MNFSRGENLVGGTFHIDVTDQMSLFFHPGCHLTTSWAVGLKEVKDGFWLLGEP